MGKVRKIQGRGSSHSRPHLIIPVGKPRVSVSSRKWILVVGAIMLIALLLPLGVLKLPSFISLTSTPPSVTNPPIYPGAEDVEVVSHSSELQEVTFRTTDTNSQIVDYYTESLTREGWRRLDDLYGDIQFEWSSFALDGGLRDTYYFDISFAGYSRSKVTLTVRKFKGWDAFSENTFEETQTATPPVVNISMQDYNEALGKWRAAGIEEYEITVVTFSMFGGTQTSRVNTRNGSLLIIFPSPTPAITPMPDYIEYARSDTVEGMFAEIERFLASDTVIHSGAFMSTGDFYMAYEVEFDRELGYPVRLSGHPVTAPGAKVYDADWAKRVTEMRILKKNVPTPSDKR